MPDGTSIGQSGTANSIPDLLRGAGGQNLSIPDIMQNLEDINRRKQATLAPMEQKFQATLSADQGTLDKKLKELTDRQDQITAPPAPPQTDPMRGFASNASLFGLIASAFTRTPAVAAMSAMAGAINAQKAGDMQAYEEKKQQWKEQTDLAIEKNRLMSDELSAVMEKMRTDVTAGNAAMQQWAAKFQDEAALRLQEAGLGFRVQELQNARNSSALNMRKYLTDIDEHEKDRQEKVREFNVTNYGQETPPAAAQPGAPGTAPSSAAAPASALPAGGPYNEDVLKNQPPAVAATVKALADGRMPFPSGFALRSPYYQRLLGLVSEYDPTFDAVNYNSRAKTRADFTSGQAAKNITALNTAIGHIGKLQDAWRALNNGSIPAFNSILNSLASETGDGRITSFETAKSAVADEPERVFRGTGGSVTGIKSWAENLSRNASPDQQAHAWDTLADLLNSRIDALGDQYSRGMGRDTDPMQLLSPTARQTYEKLFGHEPPSPGYGEMGQREGGAGIPPGSRTATNPQTGQRVYLPPGGTQWLPIP